MTKNQLIIKLLQKQAEELGEAVQAAMKYANHGPLAFFEDQTYHNDLDLAKELGDVLAVVGLLVQVGAIDENVLMDRALAKAKYFENIYLQIPLE